MVNCIHYNSKVNLKFVLFKCSDIFFCVISNFNFSYTPYYSECIEIVQKSILSLWWNMCFIVSYENTRLSVCPNPRSSTQTTEPVFTSLYSGHIYIFLFTYKLNIKILCTVYECAKSKMFPICLC